jgi:hypothetical protein
MHPSCHYAHNNMALMALELDLRVNLCAVVNCAAHWHENCLSISE